MLLEPVYNEIRLAAEVHRQVRQDAQRWIKPGMKLFDICERLEANVRHMIEESGLERGHAFPTGCSINRIAAHYTPNGGDDTVLGEDDVVKFDFGTHVNVSQLIIVSLSFFLSFIHSFIYSFIHSSSFILSSHLTTGSHHRLCMDDALQSQVRSPR